MRRACLCRRTARVAARRSRRAPCLASRSATCGWRPWTPKPPATPRRSWRWRTCASGRSTRRAGARDGAVRSFQRAAALAPTSIAISKRLEEARAAPAAATPAADGAATLASRAHAGAGPSSAVGTFDVSLDAVDAAWEATGLKHIKASEWYDLRRKACPHGVTLSPADEVAGCALFDASLFSATPETRETRETKKSNRAALKNLRDVAAHAVPSEKYAEKELFAERAMSLYAKKRASGGALPRGEHVAGPRVRGGEHRRARARRAAAHLRVPGQHLRVVRGLLRRGRAVQLRAGD